MAGETTIISESTVIQLVSEGFQGPPGPPAEEEMVYAKRIDFVGDSVIYKGEAAVGTANSAAAWRIRRITILSDGDTLEEWAGGSASFDKVWDNRASLSYS